MKKIVLPRILYETNLAGTNHILPFLSFLAVFFAIYTIVTKNPILSVLFLIGLFLSISLYLITIGLQFLGLVYLIVYVGAVSILFLFILMLINVRISELMPDYSNSVSLAIFTILCFNYTINDILPYTSYLHNTLDTYNIKTFYSYLSNIMPMQMLNGTNDMLTSIFYYLLYVNVINISSKTWDAMIVTASHITSIGNILYTNLLVLFIITSLILLLAMVGAIIITISKSKTNDEWNLTNPPKPHAFVNIPLQSKLSFKPLMLTFAAGKTITLGLKSICLLLITLCLKNGYMFLGKAITVFVCGMLSFVFIRNFNQLPDVWLTKYFYYI